MLGIGGTLSKRVRKPHFNPIAIKNLIAWFDFGDKKSMYTNGGTTNVSSDDDLVYRVDNKAYWMQNRTSNVMCRYVEQSGSSFRPLFKMVGTKRFVRFDGSDDSLFAKKDQGNVATNSMSSQTINGRAFTLFFVTAAGSATVSNDETLINWTSNSVSADRMGVIVNNTVSNDRWEFNDVNASARTTTTVNCGQDLTTSTELWTLRMDSGSSNDLYRNGDTTDGVTNGAGDNHSIDLSGNTNSQFTIGGQTASLSGVILPWRGDVYEIVMYNKILNNREVKEVERFLKSKHNIN